MSLCPAQVVLLDVMGREGKGCPANLLSDQVHVVVRLGLEVAVAGPQVDRYADAGDAALVHLFLTSTLRRLALLCHHSTYHVRRLCTRDSELEVGIFLPIPVEQREAGEEAIVDFAGGCDGLWTRVAVDATFLLLSGEDELVPVLELLRVGELHRG